MINNITLGLQYSFTIPHEFVLSRLDLVQYFTIKNAICCAVNVWKTIWKFWKQLPCIYLSVVFIQIIFNDDDSDDNTNFIRYNNLGGRS